MKTQTSCSDQPCDRTIAERPRYYPRQLITPDDLTLEQDYFRSKLRFHNRLLHGWGVVCGAEVKATPKSGSTDPEPWKITVGRGYVLGPHGDEINIDCERVIDVRTSGVMGITGASCAEVMDPWCSEVLEQPDDGGPLYVAVRYRQLATRPVRVQPIACGCDDSRCENSRWFDGYEIAILRYEPECFQDAPDIGDWFRTGETPECAPCPDEPWVVLAQLTVDDAGAVEVDNCACRRLAVSFANLWWVCSSTAPAPAECTKFDEYGDLNTLDENARLDNFSLTLQQNPNITAFIITFGKATAEATTRGNRAKDYLVNTRGVDASRITMIDGGTVQTFKIELWTCPPNARPPAAGPESRADAGAEKAATKGSAVASKKAAPRKRGGGQ
jgi:hypothetical protein